MLAIKLARQHTEIKTCIVEHVEGLINGLSKYWFRAGLRVDGPTTAFY